MRRGKTLDEYMTECKPIAEAKGIEIVGINGEFIGCKTKMINRCPDHGEWNTTTFKNFKRGYGCPVCKAENIGKANTVPDDQHIADFFATGAFQPGTIFTNTGKRNGSNILWCVECPVCSVDEYVKAGVCDGYFFSDTSNLKRGRIPCRCAKAYRYTEDQITYRVRKDLHKKGLTLIEWIGKPSTQGKFKFGCKDHGEQIGRANDLLHRGCGCPQCVNQTQQQAYINHIYEESGVLCALKFGIANDSDQRIKYQNRNNVLMMKQAQVWTFPTVKQCKDAESMCKHLLDTGAVSKYAMPDGYTETVELSCLASIQNIYKLYGGTLQEETC